MILEAPSGRHRELHVKPEAHFSSAKGLQTGRAAEGVHWPSTSPEAAVAPCKENHTAKAHGFYTSMSLDPTLTAVSATLCHPLGMPMCLGTDVMPTLLQGSVHPTHVRIEYDDMTHVIQYNNMTYHNIRLQSTL